METPDTPVTESRKKVSSFFVWMFAAVGFLAALVQILSFLSSGGSQLKVRVTPHETAIQKVVYEALEDSNKRTGFAARVVAEDKKFFCEAAKLETAEDKAAKNRTADRCSDYEALEGIFRLLRGNDGIDNYFDYEIENVGSSVANQIRLSGDEIFLVEIDRDGDKVRRIAQSENQGFYSIPDLNPGEKVKIRVWSEDMSVLPDSPHLDIDELPKITFEGGKPSLTMYQLAPSWYADMHDFLSDFPLPVSIIIVLVYSTAVGIAVILLIAVVSTLMAGEPLKKVFQQPEKALKPEKMAAPKDKARSPHSR